MKRLCVMLACALALVQGPAASDVIGRIDRAVSEAGHAGVAMVSPARAFPPCDGAPDIAPVSPTWEAVEVICARPAWRRTVRIGTGLRGARGGLSPEAAHPQSHVILRVSLARGTILHENHLDLAPAPARRVSGALTVPEEALGRRLRANLGAGQVLLARHLAPDWGVEEGAPVTLVMDMGLVVIETAGIARASAQIGEVIGALNARSGRTVHGEVIARNKIRIRPNMRAPSAVLNCRRSSQRCRKE
ncbi:MAG: flagellar basal body P-ring formation chaperone FlgA [Pseudomonadota bacterium]